VTEKSVLIVDEVADSGRSLRLIKEHIMERGARQVKTATLFYKNECTLKPDYYESETDCWVVFPWEIKETIRNIMETHKNAAYQTENELGKLAAAGVPKRLISRFLKEFSEVKMC
jgi:uncharacterized protein